MLLNRSVLYSLSLFSLTLFFFYKKEEEGKGKERKGKELYIVQKRCRYGNKRIAPGTKKLTKKCGTKKNPFFGVTWCETSKAFLIAGREMHLW
jgi:hypothetical protein